jgi:integrase
VYNKAIELDLIEAKPNFPKPFKMKPKEGFLDTDEVGRLLKVLKKYDKLYSLYFQTVLFTGARKTEVCSMTWDSLDLNRGLWIRRQKGGSKVPTAISDQLNKDLKKWKTHQFHSSVLHGTPWVFPSTKDPQERLKDPMKHWKTICALADIQNATIHTLRHTCASWMVQDGASLSVIGKQLGHRQTSTTERYAHLDITSTKAAVNSVEKKMLTSLSK